MFHRSYLSFGLVAFALFANPLDKTTGPTSTLNIAAGDATALHRFPQTDPCQSLRNQVQNFICDTAQSNPKACQIQARELSQQLQACQAKYSFKIMPLGDSITFGFRDPEYGSYRHLLGKLLQSDGYLFYFVGSLKSGYEIIPDPDNEGHVGWTISQIKDGIDSKGWLETYQPDLVLLHIGTNDFRLGQGASATANLSLLLDDILKRLPRTRVIVARIIPPRSGPTPAYQKYLDAIPGIVASKGGRISMADMENVLSSSDYADALHPNRGGYDKMALVWEPGICDVFRSRRWKLPQ